MLRTDKGQQKHGGLSHFSVWLRVNVNVRCRVSRCERSHRFLYSAVPVNTWTMCGRCFFRKISFKCGIVMIWQGRTTLECVGYSHQRSRPICSCQLFEISPSFPLTKQHRPYTEPRQCYIHRESFWKWEQTQTSPWPLLRQSLNRMRNQEREHKNRMTKRVNQYSLSITVNLLKRLFH